MNHLPRRPIVGVMGSGMSGSHDTLAYNLGKALAEAGYVVLTGGGDGIMRFASQGAAEAGGLVVGILPSNGPHDTSYTGYPNPYVHIPIYTGMSVARNSINVSSSDVVVALPGGAGTLSEIALALNIRRPVIILGWPELMLPERCPIELVQYVDDVPSALACIGNLL